MKPSLSILDRLARWVYWHGWIGAGPRFTITIRLPGLPCLWWWATRRRDAYLADGRQDPNTRTL